MIKDPSVSLIASSSHRILCNLSLYYPYPTPNQALTPTNRFYRDYHVKCAPPSPQLHKEVLKEEMKKDDVYVKPFDRIDAFAFDEQVADVFENMITRSVPGYGHFLELIGLVAERFSQPGSRCYDLGCSLGASTLMLRRHVPANCHVVGVDNSAAMVERCRANIQRDHSGATIEIREEDLKDTPITNASVVVLNFTLQFIAPDDRPRVLKNIAAGMIPGGALVLAEKIAFEDEREATFMTDLHHDFKRYQGYSDLEIAQKRAALENVLVPDSLATHRARLLSAGFETVYEMSRSLNFTSLICVR